MKTRLLFILTLLLNQLSAQELEVQVNIDAGYAFSYNNLDRLSEVTAIETELPAFQYGAFFGLGMVIKNVEFNFNIRSLIAEEGEEQRFLRSQARIGLGYHLKLSNTWKLRTLLGIIEEAGEYQVKAPSYILPGPVPVGNFNHYMYEQYYVFIQPGLVWMPKKKMMPILPDWLELRPNIGLPIGTGTLRWRAGDGQNLLDQSLWDYQLMFDIGFGWTIGN